MFAADSCNLEPELYARVHRKVGRVDALFLGMECDGAPLTWLYGPLLMGPVSRRADESRTLSGSNYDQAVDMVRRFQCREVYVYAMGQEPWLNQVMRIKYTDESKPIGWFVPSTGREAVVLVPGYKDTRAVLLTTAKMLYRHGYSVLIASTRAHDAGEGDHITFGSRQMADIDAWLGWLCSRTAIDPERIGIYGVSLGSTMALLFAARCRQVRAIAVQSAFCSLTETMAFAITRLTGLPAVPFAPLIRVLAEREARFDAAEIDAALCIGRISPRPVLVIHGGADVVIPATSGERLYAAAREPKELWVEADVGHAEFDRAMPEAFEQRLVGFFDRALKGAGGH